MGTAKMTLVSSTTIQTWLNVGIATVKLTPRLHLVQKSHKPVL